METHPVRLKGESGRVTVRDLYPYMHIHREVRERATDIEQTFTRIESETHTQWKIESEKGQKMYA